MAQMTSALYKNLAEDYNSARATMLSVDDYILTAVNRVVDLTTVTSGALMVELDLLSPLNGAYVATTNIVNSASSLLTAVRAINNNIINNSDAGANDPLTSFVNSIWDCVPIYWAALSADAGYDTSGWNVCS